MKSIKKMIAVVVLCIVSAAASAQQMPPGAANGGARVERALMQLQTRFANANTTHDGKLTREQRLKAMEFTPVTSEMTVRQMVRFMDTVERECVENGVQLTQPEPDLAAYNNRYRTQETRAA